MSRSRLILQWNCTTICNSARFQELNRVVDDLRPLAVVLNETRRKPGLAPLSMKGYDWLEIPCRPNGGGGVGIFIHDSIPYRVLDQFQYPQPNMAHDPNTWPQCLTIQVTLSKAESCIIAGCYVPPSSLQSEFDALLALLSPAVTSGLPFLLIGDLNAKHKSWSPGSSPNKRGHILAAWADDQDLSIMNVDHAPGVPTFPRGNSVLDLAISSNPGVFTKFRVASHLALVAEHHPILVTLSPGLGFADPVAAKASYSRWRLEKANWAQYTMLLDSLLESTFAGSVSPLLKDLRHKRRTAQEVIENVWEHIKSCMTTAARAAVGRKRVREKDKNWWTSLPEVKDAYTVYRAAYSSHRHDPKNDQLKRAYHEARNHWRSVMAAAKQKSWGDLCSKLNGPGNRIDWKVWSRVSERDRDPVPIASIRPAANVAAAAPQVDHSVPSFEEGLNALADHFARISQTPDIHVTEVENFVQKILSGQKAIESEIPEDDPTYLPNFPTYDKFKLFFTEKEIEEALRKLPHKVSVGPDEIPFDFLRFGGPKFIHNLRLLFYLSVIHSVLPLEWRRANVIPIYKQEGDRSNPDNYRPISITCTVVRLFERLVFLRLYETVEPKLKQFQSGFRKHRSTVDQILYVVERIKEALRRGDDLPVVYLDIRKAFDRVWHDGLLYKLYKMGVIGPMWKWIRAFLSGRQLRVVYKGHFSKWFSISAGVPQGSVLAPLLFLIYINDLLVEMEEAGLPCPLFADDTALVPPEWARQPHQWFYAIQKALDIAYAWSRKWKIEWGASKSQIVLYQNHKVRHVLPQPFRLGPIVLVQVVSYCYLGVDLHENLCWDIHFTRVYRKACFSCHLVVQSLASSNGPTLPIVRCLVLSIIRASFAYALPIWRPTQAQYTKLQRCIVRPLRVCLKLPQTTSIQALLFECGIPSLEVFSNHLALRLASRLAKRFGPTHPSLQIFNVYYKRRRVAKGDGRYAPFGRLVKKIEGVWQVDHAKDWITAKELLVKCHKWFLDYQGGDYLKAVKKTTNLSPFYKVDNRDLAAHRARLRLDRAKLNFSFHQRKWVDSPDCEHCAKNLNISAHETPDHVISVCPAYSNARAKLQRILSLNRYVFSTKLVLGEYPKRMPKFVRCEIDRFLLEVHNQRQF